MYIKKIRIENFKGFKGIFSLELNEGLNILVGDNEAWKSTILEAIHLILSGMLNGKYLKNELTQYLFNSEIVAEYLDSLLKKTPLMPPHILIEIFIGGPSLPMFEWTHNSDKTSECGFHLNLCMSDKYLAEYATLIKSGCDIKTLPIEYFDFCIKSFAGTEITPRFMPIKSALIDSSSNRYQNGSDIYISRIVRELLGPQEIIDVSQAHRRMKEWFMAESSIAAINVRLNTAAGISDKRVTLSVDLSSKNAWENSLVTYLDDIPFHYIGKWEQCIVKTKLALENKKTKDAHLILLEEPENHLSHTKLNQLIYEIRTKGTGKQIIVSTHSSFVANKLGLENLVLLSDKKTIRLRDLNPDTQEFFQKIPGYDTLRLILCKKAILVEGDCDELIIQKAYMNNNSQKLPIDEGIDVISVWTSFLRFLEIAEKINKPTVVVTDNDGNVTGLEEKYEEYLGTKAKKNIKICFDNVVDTWALTIGKLAKPFNYNTLEPKLLKVNGLSLLSKILGLTISEDDLHRYMKAHKTECALKMFNTTESIKFPDYILEAIK